jgi:hypothetical protein
MGKASSSKKVARAQRAAGRPGSGRNLGWPMAIGAVVVVGVLIITISRGNTDDVSPPALGDHWHAAYGIYDCGTFLPNLTDQVPDESGLHTHADGLMHMHPFGTRYTGDGANIGNWGETVGLTLTDTSFSAGTIERENGDSCGDELGEGTVQLKVWDSPDDEDGRLLDGDFADYAPQDFSMFVLAFVPEGTEIPKPPAENIANLRAPVDVVGSTIPPIDPALTSTTAPGTETTASTAPGTETTAPGTETTASTEPTGSTSTTGSTTTSTAGASTTTTSP